MGERVVVLQPSSGERLAIVHEPPERAAPLGVLILVGGPQYRVGSHRQFTLMARSIAAGGHPAMRFDYGGMGDSGGPATSFEDAWEEIRVALEAFRASVPGLGPVVLWGLCDAASSILMGAASEPGVAGVVLVNPWVRTPSGEADAYVRHYYRGRLTQRAFWRRLLAGDINPWRAARGFLAHVRQARASSPGRPSFIERMRAGAAAYRGPILLLISGQDLVAREFEQLVAATPAWRFLASRAQTRWFRMPEADHTFSARADLQRATEACLQWLRELDGAHA